MADGKRIGGISVGLGLNADKFTKGLASARRQMTAFQSTMNKSIGGVKSFGAALAGGVTLGAMASFTKQGIDQIGALADLSDKLGISTEKLAGYQIAAEDSSVSQGTFERSILKMTKGINEATMGMGTAAKAYAKLGLNVEQLNRMAPDEQLLSVMDAMKGLTGQNEKLNVAMQLFGTKGSDMVRMLDVGREGMVQFQEQARLTGQSIADDLARQVEGAGDKLAKFERTLNSFKLKAAIAVTPAISALDEALTGIQANPGDMTTYARRVAMNAMSPLGWLAEQGLRGAGGVGRSGLGRGLESPLSTKGLFDSNPSLPGVDMKALEAARKATEVAKGNEALRNLIGSLTDQAKGLPGTRLGGMRLGDLANTAGSWKWMLGQQAAQGVGGVMGLLGGPTKSLAKGVGQRPALSFAESGSADSYRQQAAIRRQSESIEKKQLDAQQQIVAELKDMRRNAVRLMPINL